MTSSADNTRIIPFPARPRAAPAASDAAVQARLRQALAALDAALAMQRKAVADWCASAGTLQDSAGQLRKNAASFQDALDRLAAEIGRVHARGQRLATCAE